MLHLQTIEALGNDQFISVDAANACNDFALCADYKETLKIKKSPPVIGSNMEGKSSILPSVIGTTNDTVVPFYSDYTTYILGFSIVLSNMR